MVARESRKKARSVKTGKRARSTHIPPANYPPQADTTQARFCRGSPVLTVPVFVEEDRVADTRAARIGEKPDLHLAVPLSLIEQDLRMPGDSGVKVRLWFRGQAPVAVSPFRLSFDVSVNDLQDRLRERGIGRGFDEATPLPLGVMASRVEAATPSESRVVDRVPSARPDQIGGLELGEDSRIGSTRSSPVRNQASQDQPRQRDQDQERANPELGDLDGSPPPPTNSRSEPRGGPSFSGEVEV